MIDAIAKNNNTAVKLVAVEPEQRVEQLDEDCGQRHIGANQRGFCVNSGNGRVDLEYVRHEPKNALLPPEERSLARRMRETTACSWADSSIEPI
jgi:hypothetical protein